MGFSHHFHRSLLEPTKCDAPHQSAVLKYILHPVHLKSYRKLSSPPSKIILFNVGKHLVKAYIYNFIYKYIVKVFKTQFHVLLLELQVSIQHC